MDVEHKCVVYPCQVCFDLGENVVDQVVVVDFGVYELGRISADAGGNQSDAPLFIDGWFPFCHNDQAGSKLIEAGVHARGGFGSPGEGHTNVGLVSHAIGLEGIENGLLDLCSRRYIHKGHGFCRGKHSIQVFVQTKNAAIVDADAFPNGISTLDDAVEYGDFGFFSGTISPPT